MTAYIINGQRIFVREEGPPDGQIALFIHGWSSSWYALSPLLPLMGKRFSCVALDLPGYGNSPPFKQRVTITDYADLLASLIQEVTDKPVVLVGHSMGGMISLTIAMRHPVLVERMVLLNPTISGRLSARINWLVSPITSLERFSLAGQLISLLEPHLLSVTDWMMKPVSFADRSGITEDEYKRLRADARRRGQGRVRAECFRAMRGNDLRGKLDQVEAPALVLWGAEDNTVPLRDAGIVDNEYANADLRILPNAGHWPQFETPEITLRYIASFLGLPLVATSLDEANTDAVIVSQAAQFLAHSDVGNGLTLAQRMRLAAQCTIRLYEPGSEIAQAQDPSTDLYIVQDGTVEVWNDLQAMSQPADSTALQHLATLTPGQITGELSLLDGNRRSASLWAGKQGTTIMMLSRERLVALAEDDPQLGRQLIWNIATALALRLRRTNWRLHQAQQELQMRPAVVQPASLPVEHEAS
jgi:pimeloyl-ACP methyl ester carboxylesterase/CRP-like cAMP-binding protein